MLLEVLSVTLRNISRRRFLEHVGRSAVGAMAFPYIIPSSALGADGVVAPSNRITLGFVGLGNQGLANLSNPNAESYNLAGGFVGMSGAQVLAVCEVDTNRRNRGRDIVNKVYGNTDCAVYNDFRDMLARDDVDAVVISTPDHWHALIGIAAAKTGKDVYSEKPLAHNVAEGRAICDTIKRYGTVWQTGTQQRSWSDFRVACELVRNGLIGKVKTVRVSLPAGGASNVTTKPVPVPAGLDYDLWLGPAPWSPYCNGRCYGSFRQVSDYSSGPIADWAGHHVDIAQWGMGTDYTGPVEIEAKGQFNSEGLFDNMTTYRIECKYAEGHTLIIEDSNNREHGRDGKLFTKGTFGMNIGILFEGSEGWIQVNRMGMDVFPESVRKSSIGPNDIHLYKSNDHKQNFLECIRSRAQTAAPAEIAHRTITIGYLGIIAMKLGQKLQWDPKTEKFVGNEHANRMLTRPMRSPWHI